MASPTKKTWTARNRRDAKLLVKRNKAVRKRMTKKAAK